MSSALVIRNKPFKRGPTMFDECVMAQRSSSDIVIYSALASQIVTVAWPTYRGVKITPSGIKEWLRARGLHWSCFCGITAPLNVHLSSRIVHALSGEVLVFCHDEPTTCDFFLNLSKVCESTSFESEYPLLPKNQLPGNERYDAMEVINFQLGQLVASDVAPYLKGYCGDFIPGVEQMSSSRQQFVKSSSTAIRRQSRASLPNIFDPNQSMSESAPVHRTAGPSTLTQLDVQRRVIARLARGEGIALLEWDGVIETCNNCQTTFLGAYFKGHARGKECWAD